MLLVARVRLTSPLLGELKPDNGAVRRFRKDNGNTAVNAEEWRETIHQAARQMGINFDVKKVVPPRALIPASIHLYARRYNQVKVEYFESFRKGTILTMDFMLLEGKLAPTLPQFESAWRLVGSHFGISQWGNKFGFGRFEVLEVKPINQENEHELPGREDLASAQSI